MPRLGVVVASDVRSNDGSKLTSYITLFYLFILIRLYNTVGEENRVVREVNRDRLC